MTRTVSKATRFLLAIALWAFVVLVATSCFGANRETGAGFQGREAILLWHNLPEPEATAFNHVIDRYRRANPGVDIIVQQQDAEMDADFLRATRSGLGPDLLLTNSTAVRALVEANTILPLTSRMNEETLARYLTVALRTLRYNGELYGLPLAVDTQVLYYNRSLVDKPPTTTELLLQEANSGQRVLMNSQFFDAIWSARAFGVALFDNDDNPQNAAAGIANWLSWMEQLRDTPGFVIDDDTQALRNRFLEGDIPYYIGHSREMNLVGESLGANLGATQLPAGPAGSAGPPLTTLALLINAVSSPAQIERSLDLARFITSSDQQGAIMREANLVPANGRTRISEGLYPHIATVTAQARTAIPFSNEPHIQEVYALLGTAYNRTMAGLTSPTEAAASVQATLIDEFGFPDTQSALRSCLDRGELILLTANSDNQRAILRILLDGFATVCPNITVTLRDAPEADIETLVHEEGLAGVDLFFLSHQNLPALLQAEVLRPISDLIDPALLREMRPRALEAMQVDNELYGTPLFVELQTLFYNTALVSDAAGTLADLRAQAQTGVPVVLDGSFAWSFWGVGAFGGRLFGEDGQFALSPTALAEWLAWLQESQKDFAIRTTPEHSEAEQLFLEGASAYHVASSIDFDDLLKQIAQENLSVALMPQGPAGSGRPLAQVDGIMASVALSEAQSLLVSRFLNYSASAQAQTDLLRWRRLLPANSAVLLDGDPLVMRMAEQFQTAVVLQNKPWLAILFALGDAAYRNVLIDGAAPADAVTQMFEALSAEADRYDIIMPTPAPTRPPSDEMPPAEALPFPEESETPPSEDAQEGSAP